MAAASKTSSSFHNMPHRNGTYMASHGTSATSEVTPDLHLKMSKKIAQLTKVIYALNTKNDEHEAITDTLKKSHEEEMQQLIAETRNKLDYFKTRLGVVSEQKEKIVFLESHISQERLQREEALSEFEIFKQQSEEKGARLRGEYSDRMLSLSKEMLSSKKLFEDRLKEFQSMRKTLEEDRDKVVEDMTSTHHEELDRLMKAHRVRYDEVMKEKQKLEQDLKEKLGKVKAQIDSKSVNALDERKQIEKEYQEKMDKLKIFYEKELAALRAAEVNDVKSKESEQKSLEEREKQLRLEWNRQERIFKERISELLNQLSDGEQEMSVLSSQLRDLKGRMEGKHSDAVQLSRQLEESRRESTNALGEVRELKNELKISSKRCEEQRGEISRQSTSVGKLEATKLSQETTIRSLKANINELNNKLSKLEGDYEELEKQYKTHFMDSGEHIETLKEEIRKVSAEKADVEGKYLKELSLSKESASERENSMKRELEDTTSKLRTDHKRELEKLNDEMNKKLRTLEQTLKQQSQSEKDAILKEKGQIIGELEKEYGELKRKFQSIEEESKRLDSLVQESEKGLGSASSHIHSLKQALKESKESLEKTQKELQEMTVRSTSFQNDLVKLQAVHDEFKVEVESKLQSSLLSLTAELDGKWSDRLSKECSELRVTLNEQHREESRASLEEMRRIKDLEREEMKVDLESRNNTLKQKVEYLENEKCILQQITDKYIIELQDSLDRRQMDASVVEQQLHKELDKQRRMHEEELARVTLEHNKKVKSMEENHAEEMKKLKELGEQQLKDLESKFLVKHHEDMAFNLQANKLALDSVKSQAEQQRQKRLDELKSQHEIDQESLRKELVRKQQEETQRLSKAFETQMMAMKLQLQRMLEIRNREEAEKETNLDELRQEIEQRDIQIMELDEEMGNIDSNLKQLQQELQTKGHEILSIRREANTQSRKREEQLGKLHQREVDSLTADHLLETQALLAEFNRAKELQNDKISALQLMLEEAEIRFKNRESRPEDMDLIGILKRTLAERELEMKKLLDEKRYFQLELLNRETNFNKVFRSAPNVGVINPLNAKTKVKSKITSPSSSRLLMSSSKLDPIPHMPVHEKRLNNSKVLPPTPPKNPPPPNRRTVVY